LYKLVTALRRTYREDLVPQEQVDEWKKRYDEVKKDYEISDCKKCGTKRMNHTWNKLDMVAMAARTKPLSALIVDAYLGPLGYVHSTVQALLAYVETAPSGTMLSVNPGPRRHEADQALHFAHFIILAVLATQKNFFKVQGLDPLVKTCFEDFEAIWPERGSSSTGETPGATGPQ
jgi:hypothetical protein